MAKITPDVKEKRKQERKQKKYNETHKIMNDVEHKICTICNEWYPSNVDYFHKNKSNGIDGLYPYCKNCHTEKSMNWQSNNKDKLAISRHKYAMKPQRRQQVRDYGKNRRESGEYQKWQKSNPDRIQRYNVARKHRNHKITNREWESCLLYFDFQCAYCGFSLEDHLDQYQQQLHKEHVDHEGANDLSNCVPACKACNSEKHTYSLDEWYNDENDNFTNQRRDKIISWISGVFQAFKESITFK